MGKAIKPYDYIEFLRRWRSKFDNEHGIISIGLLRRLVMADFGSDYRTVRNHLSNMEFLGILMRRDGTTYGIRWDILQEINRVEERDMRLSTLKQIKEATSKLRERLEKKRGVSA